VIKQTSWDLLLTERERTRASSVVDPLNGTPFLVLGISSKMQATDWGIENWKTLMPRLQQEFPEHAAVFIGAKEDRLAAEEVAARWPGGSLNLSGELSPRESAAVIERGDLFLGLDSGPMQRYAPSRKRGAFRPSPSMKSLRRQDAPGVGIWNLALAEL
jgi:heptosyltransferase-3